LTSDFNEFIQRELQDDIIETVYDRRLDLLKRLFPAASPIEGDRVTEKFEVARSSPSAAFTKADVNPSSASNTLVKPYWDRAFYHTAAEVEGIDLSNSRNFDMAGYEIKRETETLMDTIFTAMMAQLLADVDSSGTAYSDASLSRSTYATLGSYEETTDTQITAAIMRTMIDSVRLLKNSGPKNGFVILTEEAVFNAFNPLAAVLHAWTLNEVKAGDVLDMGYQPARSFDGVPVEVPDGMTTGQVFMLRRQDVRITEHLPLQIVPEESHRFSSKWVIRTGINIHVVHPGFQGKMLDKD